jgi:hypothetical protein
VTTGQSLPTATKPRREHSFRKREKGDFVGQPTIQMCSPSGLIRGWELGQVARDLQVEPNVPERQGLVAQRFSDILPPMNSWKINDKISRGHRRQTKDSPVYSCVTMNTKIICSNELWGHLYGDEEMMIPSQRNNLRLLLSNQKLIQEIALKIQPVSGHF